LPAPKDRRQGRLGLERMGENPAGQNKRIQRTYVGQGTNEENEKSFLARKKGKKKKKTKPPRRMAILTFPVNWKDQTEKKQEAELQ